MSDAEVAARTPPEHDGLRHVDLSRTLLSAAAASLLPEETARRYRAVAIDRRRDTTVVAVADPTDPETMRAVRAAVGGEVVTVAAPPDQLDAAIGRIYGHGPQRDGRRRGQHAPRGEADGAENGSTAEEAYRPARFATSDALLAPGGPGVQPRSPRGEPSRPVTSLEEALRDVLTPPDVDHRMPPPIPASPFRSVVPEAGSPGSQQRSADDPQAPGRGHDGRGGAAALMTTDGTAVRTGVAAAPAMSQTAPAPGAPAAARTLETPASRPAAKPAQASPSTQTPLPGLGEGQAVGLQTPSATAPATVPGPAPAAQPAPAAPAPADQRTLLAADVHWPPLARVLVTSGRVTYDEMVRALHAHRESGDSLARYLFNNQLATEEDLVRAMAEEVGLEYVDLSAFPVDAAAASLIPDAVARRHMVLPIRVDHGVPVVAMANPTDVFAMDDLRSIMGRNFTPVVSTRTQIASRLRYVQESDTDVEEAAQSAAGTVGPGSGFELESLQSVVEDAPIVRYVNLLILQALNERASDIHIEPTPRRLRIRFRIDGVMHDASSASPAIHASVVSRLKVLGEMDITEHRLPQEGRVSVSVGDRQIDLRLATLPSLYGETCVMRLLDKSASIRQLSELGFLPDTLERYSHAYSHPYGVILVTGPTGAGKTTTLYATLHEVMTKEKSVVTVEDPVEYQIDGITQVQINPKVGLQFSTALRSILRADPDIVLVGEIRDIETATIAMEAALSGHLVLSTLHTNTAAATPLRLTEMGIEPFLVTSAVGGVLTQRLARVLCERCKAPYDASLTDFYAAGYKEADLEGLDTSALYRANGCRSCSHTGYHGRMVLAEVMPVTEEIERMIIEQQSIVAMERQAVEQGMRTLRQDGLLKAIAGVTTLEEVLRVVV